MKHYYRVTEGPIFDTLTAIVLQMNAARDAVMDWKAKHQLPVTGVSCTKVWFEDGFSPDKAVWKKMGKDGAFTPRATTPEGKELKKELEGLPKAVGWFDVLLAFSTAYGKDLMMVNSKGAIGFVKVPAERAFYMACDPYWLPDDQAGILEVTGSTYEAKLKP